MQIFGIKKLALITNSVGEKAEWEDFLVVFADCKRSHTSCN